MADIRKLTADQCDEFARIHAGAYPGIKKNSAEDQARFVERLRSRLDDGFAVSYCLYRDGRMVGIMCLYDFSLNVRGALVPAGGVGDVAVDLMHKKTHIAREMMAFYLQHYHDRGAPVAVLWPFRHNFYRRMGFGHGGRSYQYRIRPHDIPGTESGEGVRFLTQSDIPAMVACYDRLYRQRTGMLEETERYWQWVFEGRPNMRVVGCEHDGRIDGFLIYKFYYPNPRNFMQHDLVVSRLVYNSRESLAGLLGFLHAQRDQVNRVVITVSDDEFYFLPDEPRNDSDRMIPPVNQESHTCGVGIMYRVLDTRRLFRALADHDFNGVTLKLRIDIDDSFFASNHGSVTIDFVDGKPVVSDSQACDVAISLKVAEFSSLVMGSIRFRTLHLYRQAEISDLRFLDVVDRLFATEHKPICLTGF